MPVTHVKTNTITDWTQADLDAQIALGNFPPGTLLADIVLPSDWNAAHTVSVSVSEITATGTPSNTTFLRGDGSWQTNGSGTVTSASIVSANGFAGSVTNATTTPAITLTTTITGILSGNGTAISAATTTGTGDVVLSNSPVLTTPDIGSATGSVSGNAGTATALQNARLIGNVSFNGTADITPTQIQPAAENSDTTCFPLFANAASGTAQQPKYNTSLTFNASTGNFGATLFNGLVITTSTGTLTVANGKTFTASNTITLTGTDSVSANVSNLKVRTIGFSATTPVTGQQGTYVVFPVAGTITGYKIVADAGTCTVKTWKIASGTAAPTIANVISTAGVSLSSGTAIISSTTSDFTSTTVSANDIFAFDLTAVATATKVLFELEITVT